MKMRIALIFGGRSAEHEVSIISARSVFDNINKEKYEVVSIYIDKEGLWRRVSSPYSEEEFKRKGFLFLPWSQKDEIFDAGLYFPLLHGPYGEDGTIQGLFEIADVPYVGAGIMGSALGMNKVKTKEILSFHKIPVVNWFSIRQSEWENRKEEVLKKCYSIPLPLFVKPSNLGSSIGISKVKDYSELPASIEKAFEWDTSVLVEEGINAREIECSVLGNDNPVASIPGEVIPYREFYDYRDKYFDGKTRFVIPADVSEEEKKNFQTLSVKAYIALECYGMARVDFLMDKETREIYVNELNTIPGFTAISMYPKLWEASGLPYPQLIEKLIELAFEKHKKKKRKLNYSVEDL
ncbi:MAG: D-alanine--D-alanine ligase family protein [Candidatus Aminicenantia bacterium]